MLTQSTIIIQKCKISNKPSVEVLLKCCWDSLLVLQTAEFKIRNIRLIRLGLLKSFSYQKVFSKPWLCQGIELSEIVPLCFVYKDN